MKKEPKRTNVKPRWSSSDGWVKRADAAPFLERPGRTFVCNESGKPPPNITPYFARPFGVKGAPQETVAHVSQVVDDAVARRTPNKGRLDIKLAELWSAALHSGLGWDSVELQSPGGSILMWAMASPDRSWFILPHKLTRAWLHLGPISQENTALLMYSMIATGALPKATAFSYMQLG